MIAKKSSSKMREIKLKENGKETIFDKYRNDVVIEKKSDGLFYICTKNETKGPFAKIFVESYPEFDNDIFIFGWNADKIQIYRDGFYGVELKDEIDNTLSLAKDLGNYVNKEEKYPKIKGFTFVQEVKRYKLLEKNTSINSGYKIETANSIRYIYTDSEGKIWVFNPYTKKMSGKFDTYDELRLNAEKMGFSYTTFHSVRESKLYSRFLTSLIRKMSQEYSIDNILNVISKIKEKFGVEILKSNEEVLWKSLPTTDLNELHKYFKSADLSNLEEEISYYLSQLKYYRNRLKLNADTDNWWFEGRVNYYQECLTDENFLMGLEKNEDILKTFPAYKRGERKFLIFKVGDINVALSWDGTDLGVYVGKDGTVYINYSEDMMQEINSLKLERCRRAREKVLLNSVVGTTDSGRTSSD